MVNYEHDSCPNHSMYIGIVCYGRGGKMGKEFIEIFEKWADSYDESLTEDIEYKEVFKDYELILTEVANRAYGAVVEFGPGTGNLTLKLADKGLSVTGLEPSKAMRKLADEKLKGKAVVKDGDFLQFSLEKNPDVFVSTYAFHHLTDEEKAEAITLYSNLLPSSGKIVFADTMFRSEEDYEKAKNAAANSGFHNLAADLAREYYSTIPALQRMLEGAGFTAVFTRMNEFVWIMEGTKV